MRIGIMGGTLDPVHNGHIEIARSVRAELGLDGVMLLPAGDPPHKKRESDKLDRLEMAKRAAAEFDWMFVSDLEIARKGTTYTVDTLRALKRKQPDAEWIYIIGADTLNILDSWRNFPEIAQLCAFAAVSRPGVSGERAYAALLKERYGAEIIFAKASGPDISSTAIRARVAEGRSIRGLAPDSVCDYIREKGLYLCAYTWNELEVLLSERLKPARFRHTMGVAETAERLARKYGADPMRARLAGMLHDCAKSMRLRSDGRAGKGKRARSGRRRARDRAGAARAGGNAAGAGRIRRARSGDSLRDSPAHAGRQKHDAPGTL